MKLLKNCPSRPYLFSSSVKNDLSLSINFRNFTTVGLKKILNYSDLMALLSSTMLCWMLRDKKRLNIFISLCLSSNFKKSSTLSCSISFWKKIYSIYIQHIKNSFVSYALSPYGLLSRKLYFDWSDIYV